MASAADTLLAREAARFVATHQYSAALAAASQPHWLGGVPLHWMLDWPTPHPVFVQRAAGAELIDVDGNAYSDFCLGDTGAMFGHSPPAVARAIAAQAGQGLTTMLPDRRVADCGRLLAELFGLPCWQLMQTASDANRAALRYARAITHRQRVLVFDGCYHGIVEETMVRADEAGGAVTRRGQIGPPFDLAERTAAVDFNDPAALERALAAGDIAAVLCEPVMTNMGMVLPAPGFHAALRAACDRHGTLLVIDETHTLSSGLGGYTRTAGLAPDLLVCGKAIAGGLPCAVLGFSAAVRTRVDAMLEARDAGHSGMGTTLSANALAVAALQAALLELHTQANYALMEQRASELANGLQLLFARHGRTWPLSRVGARLEFGFAAPPPRTGRESEGQMQPALERLLHLYLLNRGVLLTPFHNMMLCSPATTEADVGHLLSALDAALAELPP